MRYLRTAPTRRLLAVIAGVVLAAASCTAIAVAATSGGPVPRAKPLADALRDALTAGPVSGITAQVSFTNNLVSSSDIEGTDPLLTGASGRLWLTRGHLRLELQSDNGDAQVVVNNDSYWIYDPGSDTVYEGTLPSGSSAQSGSAGSPGADGVPSLLRIQTVLNRLAAHIDGLTAIPTDVAGQPAYSVRVSPAASGGLLGSVELAWDAVHGVPLSFAVYAKGDSTPVLSLQASSITYGSVPLSDFEITPPSGATVVPLSGASGSPGWWSYAPAGSGSPATSPATSGTVTPSTSGTVSFTVDDPATAGGLTLSSSKRVGANDELLTYGTGLGAVEVLERPASTSGSAPGAAGAGGPGPSELSLPTETIGASTATELVTELGTVLEFSHGGISYVVLGSVPLATANAVARAL